MTLANKQSINSFLFLLVVALLFIVQSPTPPQQLVQKINSGITKQQANKITFTIAKQQYNLVKNQQKQWHFIDPLAIKALNKRVNKILAILNYPFTSSFLANDVNLRHLGLQPAKAKLSINNINFSFGNIEPISKQRYVLFKQRIYLTKDLIYPLLDSRLQGIADTALLPQGVDIIGIKTPFFNANKNNGTWQTDKQNHANLALIEKNWRQSKAIGIQMMGDKKQQPKGKIQIKTKNTILSFNIIQYSPLLILQKNNKNFYYLLPENSKKLLLN